MIPEKYIVSYCCVGAGKDEPVLIVAGRNVVRDEDALRVGISVQAPSGCVREYVLTDGDVISRAVDAVVMERLTEVVYVVPLDENGMPAVALLFDATVPDVLDFIVENAAARAAATGE